MRNNAQYLFDLYCALLRNKTEKVNLVRFWRERGLAPGFWGCPQSYYFFD